MQFIGVDLGSTNIKAALYDEGFGCLRTESAPVVYDRAGGRVEFDAEAYVASLVGILRGLNGKDTSVITFTGQAESLVVLGKDGKPLMNAISWMDDRSAEECALTEKAFPGPVCYAHTGQPAALPTWPATKILWLRRNRPDVFAAAAHYLLLKDYVVWRLTGKMLADRSIATFTFYFDIYKGEYWPEMMDFVGIRPEQLPPLAEPCTAAGPLLPQVAEAAGIGPGAVVNLGTLDHFAGMVGVGNVTEGGLSLSTGTVMGLSILAGSPVRRDTGIPMHYGFIPGTWVMLPVAESGGVSLEWFKRACLPDVSYKEIDAQAAKRLPGDPLFLPYLVGTNAPEFDLDACGVFFGLRSRHDAYDMALAVMDGVAHLLRKNCDALRASGTEIRRIIATGGGAKSAVWCQLQADVTGIPVVIPAEKEAACLGAAMIGAVSAGVFPSYAAAAGSVVRFEKEYAPHSSERNERRHRQFCALYGDMLAVQRME